MYSGIFKSSQSPHDPQTSVDNGLALHLHLSNSCLPFHFYSAFVSKGICVQEMRYNFFQIFHCNPFQMVKRSFPTAQYKPYIYRRFDGSGATDNYCLIFFVNIISSDK